MAINSNQTLGLAQGEAKSAIFSLPGCIRKDIPPALGRVRGVWQGCGPPGPTWAPYMGNPEL